MQIKMLKTADGAEEGYRVSTFAEGETYTVRDQLGAEFVRAKLAEEVASGSGKKAAKQA